MDVISFIPSHLFYVVKKDREHGAVRHAVGRQDGSHHPHCAHDHSSLGGQALQVTEVNTVDCAVTQLCFSSTAAHRERRGR